MEICNGMIFCVRVSVELGKGMDGLRARNGGMYLSNYLIHHRFLWGVSPSVLAFLLDLPITLSAYHLGIARRRKL